MNTNTSTSEFGGSEPLGIDYYKSQLEEARERIKRLEKPITGETSDGYHSFNELYEHRHALFFALMLSNGDERKAWMSKLHDDGSSFDGWFIAGMGLSTGLITYHLPMRLWDRFASAGFDVLEKAPKWDGHTSNDVINRLYTADWSWHWRG